MASPEPLRFLPRRWRLSLIHGGLVGFWLLSCAHALATGRPMLGSEGWSWLLFASLGYQTFDAATSGLREARRRGGYQVLKRRTASLDGDALAIDDGSAVRPEAVGQVGDEQGRAVLLDDAGHLLGALTGLDDGARAFLARAREEASVRVRHIRLRTRLAGPSSLLPTLLFLAPCYAAARATGASLSGALALALVLGPVATFFLLGGEAVVGPDGLRVERLGRRPRFVPWRDVERVTRAASTPGRAAHAVLRLRSGEALPLRSDVPGVDDAFGEAHRRWLADRPADHAQEEVRARALVADRAPDPYRAPTFDVEDLRAIVADVHTPPSVRARAAGQLPADDPARDELRTRVVADEVRRALEADGTVEDHAPALRRADE